MKPIRKGKFEAHFSAPYGEKSAIIKIVIVNWQELKTVLSDIVDTRSENPVDVAYDLIDKAIKNDGNTPNDTSNIIKL